MFENDFVVDVEGEGCDEMGSFRDVYLEVWMDLRLKGLLVVG